MRGRVVAAVMIAGCSFRIGGAIQIDADVEDGPLDVAPIDSAIDGTMAIDSPMMIDAAIDAPVMIDAPMIDAPFACSTAGMVCAGGQPPFLIPCGPAGGCWVGCTNGTAIDYSAASTACIAWGGNLARIDSAAELTCMRMHLDGAIMLGLQQSGLAVTTTTLWTWNNDGLLPLYTNWAGGQPSDGDGVENGAEQCAYSGTGVTWQDEACTLVHNRYSCRR